MLDLKIKSVSEISKEIKDLLENKIGFVSVEGEISNYKPHYSGHKYFTLKDEHAQINCTMWKSRPINFNLLDGQKVIITGAINVYPPRGTYQIDVLTILPAGTGDLFQAFEMLKQKLETLGYFAQTRKKPIPDFIMNIGVSTSPTGAAVQDIISTIKRRLPCADIYFRPTIVQGDSASKDIVKAILELSQYPLDVIIVGRGGGSIEDLWSYNTEEVATAIYDCSIPIISAVGHETDFTIADFVADIRAATPTAAAELATPTQLYEIHATLDEFANEMTENILQKINGLNSILEYFNAERISRDFMNKINYNYEKIDAFADKMNRNIRFNIKTKFAEIKNIETNLTTLSPYNMLDRGYCIIQKDGKTISNNISLSEIKSFELIRKNEKVVANFDRVMV